MSSDRDQRLERVIQVSRVNDYLLAYIVADCLSRVRREQVIQLVELDTICVQGL